MTRAADKTSPPDYFNLPFEVHYSECVGVGRMEFKSDVEVMHFKDVKAIHQELGQSWGTVFLCEKNSGPELYCCVINAHDEVEPSWLEFVQEDNIEFNSGGDYKVLVDGHKIKLEQFTDDEKNINSAQYVDVEGMDYCCRYAFMFYELGDACPDYLVLDAHSTRIKVNLDGYVLDENNDPTHERIFDPDKLMEQEELCEFESRDLWEAQAQWIEMTLAKEFPQDVNLLWHH